MATSNTIRIKQLLTPATDYRTAVNAFLGRCKAKNLSPRTLEYYTQRHNAFLKWIDECRPGLTPEQTTPNDVRLYLSYESDRKGASLNRHAFVSVSVLLRWLFTEEYIETDPTARIEKPKAPNKIITTFSNQQIENLINSCGNDFVGCRDRAMIMVLMDCGLRASEAFSLTLDDINWNDCMLLVRSGKGNKDRAVPFGQTCRKSLSDYINRRGVLDTSTLLVSSYGRPLTRYTLGDLLEKRCKKLGIEGVRLSAHTFRHTSAIQLLRNGADAFSVQSFLGHSTLDMTKRYCNLVESDIKNMHQRCSPMDNMTGIKSGGTRTKIK